MRRKLNPDVSSQYNLTTRTTGIKMDVLGNARKVTSLTVSTRLMQLIAGGSAFNQTGQKT
jgi:hypothetical protein